MRLMIVDDDALSREIVAVLAADSGFCVEAHDSGESALHALATGQVGRPDVILADLQMPGLCGEPLAQQLRVACGDETVLLAMSGSFVPDEVIRSFNAFVLKPFSMEEIWTALDRSRPLPTTSPLDSLKVNPPLEVLNLTTYTSLAEVMPREQLHGLYSMCLNDAVTRLETLRQASLARDAEAWTHAAHSIKGGCGMVGAEELARMAAEMERDGLPSIGNIAPFDEFLAASSRLRRILDAQN